MNTKTENTPPAAPLVPGADATPPAGGLSQEEVNRIAAREKDQGRRAAQTELLQRLGVETIEEAEAILKSQKDAEDALKSQAQKDAEAAAKDRKEAQDALLAANTARHRALVDAALLRAGVPEAGLSAISLDVEVGAESEAITEAVEKLKTALPGLFGEAKRAAPPANPGKPGAAPAGGAGGASFGAAGAAMAEEWLKSRNS